ncbi:MAG: PEP-CTERM sorting domain-containing protein, partial [Akkermansia sp.]|nr:PEP-CTERM sorting domain-containing protein [Akkermansia sp.]
DLPTGTTVDNLSQAFAVEDGSFSVALTLNVTQLSNYLKTGGTAEKRLILSHQWEVDTTSGDTITTTPYCIGVTTNYSSSDGKITGDSGLYTRLQAPNTDSWARWEVTKDEFMITPLSGSNLATFDWSAVSAAYMTYTYGNSSAGLSIAFNLVDSDGVSLFASYGTDSALRYSSYNSYELIFDTLLVSEATYYSDTLSKAQALTAAKISSYNIAVPEPATATLSLLALAGLAARRRRK